MLFNQPIARALQPKFHEGNPMRSVRDQDNNSKQWLRNKQATNNGVTSSNAMSQVTAAINRSRRRIVAPPLTPLTVIPFTLYQYGDWNQFQIRDGFLAARSKYWKSGVKSGGGSPTIAAYDYYLYGNNTALPDGYMGNYENLLSVILDGEGIDAYGYNAQPSASSGASVTLSLLSDTIISGYDTIGNVVNYGSVKLADVGAIDWSALDYQASFWIEVIDDSTTGFFYRVYGRMWNNNGSGITQQVAFPQGENIYPIGSVRFVAAAGEPIYSQFLIGNKTNRYNSGNLIYRGKWSADSLSGQVFYPDDMVYDDTAAYLTKSITGGGGGSFTYQGQYRYKGATPDFATTAPHSDSTNWLYIGSVI
jgi:hypothetical protein